MMMKIANKKENMHIHLNSKDFGPFTETVKDYLARGGKITTLPAGSSVEVVAAQTIASLMRDGSVGPAKIDNEAVNYSRKTKENVQEAE